MLTIVAAIILFLVLATLQANSVYTPDVGKTRYARMMYGLTTNAYTNNTYKIGLYTANSAGSPYQTTYGTLTQPTFTGYALITLAGAAVGTLIADNQQPITFTAVTFQPSAGTGLPQTALGWFIVDTSDNTVMDYQAFTSPFVFSSTSSACTFTPAIGYGQLPVP